MRLAAAFLLLLVGCEAPLPGGDPWEIGYTPRGKPAEEVLRAGFSEEAAAGDAFQRGLTSAGFSPDAFTDPEGAQARRELLAIADTLQIAVPWYQADVGASSLRRHPDKTPTEASVRALIEEAHGAGLDVMLRPLVEVEDGSWRAQVEPGDPDAWFADYEEILLDAASLAEELNVRSLSVGTELSSMEGPHEDRWRALIAAIRGVFGGELTWSADWNRLDGTGAGSFLELPFWDALDAVGIDAWFPLAPEGGAMDRNALMAGWIPHLLAIEGFRAQQRATLGEALPIWFTEVGYRSVEGAAAAPWEFEEGAVPDLAHQADCYEALFTAVVAEVDWLEGVWFWWWDNPSTVDFGG